MPADWTPTRSPLSSRSQGYPRPGYRTACRHHGPRGTGGGLLARGLQTKQIARALGISVKTADRHIQNAYGKIGVSTRAAAALFAMQHGLAAWGELPIAARKGRS